MALLSMDSVCSVLAEGQFFYAICPVQELATSLRLIRALGSSPLLQPRFSGVTERMECLSVLREFIVVTYSL